MRKLLVLLIAAAFVFTMALPAMAADEKKVDLYGSVRVQTFIADTDKENNMFLGTPFDDSGLTWGLDDGSSRFGARFQSGDIGANVEIRPRDQNATSYAGSTSLMRHWYGTWNFGSGTLVVGQTWTPTFHPICNECMIGGGGFLDGYGDMGGSTRKAGLQAWFPVKGVNGMLKLALLEPTTTIKPDGPSVAGLPNKPTLSATNGYYGYSPGNPPQGGLPGYVPPTYVNPQTGAVTTSLDPLAVATLGTASKWSDVDTTIPAIEASFSGAFGPMNFMVVGGYNTYTLANKSTNEDVDIDSWVFGLDLGYSTGPFYVKGNLYTAQNLAAFGGHAPNSVGAHGFLPSLYLDAVTNAPTVEDTSENGWFGVVGFKFSDKVSLEVGYGQRTSEQDDSNTTPGLTYTNKDKKSAWTVFLPVTVAKGFKIVPEVVFTDEGDLTVQNVTQDRGNSTRYGIYWQIDF